MALPSDTREGEIHTSTRITRGAWVVFQQVRGGLASGIVHDEPEPHRAGGMVGHWVTLVFPDGRHERWLLWPAAGAPITPTADTVHLDTWDKSFDDMSHVLSNFADEIRDGSDNLVPLEVVQEWMRAELAAGRRLTFFAPLWETRAGRRVARLSQLNVHTPTRPRG